MKTSESTTKLCVALAKAQAEMSNPAFDSVNPHFRSKYASLAAVRNAIIPVFSRHGIACVQEIITNDQGRIGCVTRLLHEGEWIEFDPLFLPASKPDAQGYGSASTYARRYCLQAVAGIVGDDDDDGNEASNKKRESGTITPRGGAIERAQERTQDAELIAWAEKFKAAHANNDATAAAKVYKELKAKAAEDADFGAAVWDLLAAPVRSFVKRAGEKWTPTPEEAARIAEAEKAEA